uniref:PB1 domain-containing protein n=1 Tax=Ascaris lumbricoides TaxID=6252 RepID=A0A0M3HZ53_ASCLU
MSQSAQFKWFNGDTTRRFEIPYEDAAKLFDKLIAKMTQYGFERGKENVFWIDTDGEYILLEDSESMEIALNAHPSEGVILLESYTPEDVVFTGQRKARPRNREQMPPTGRRPGPPHYPRLLHEFAHRCGFPPMHRGPPFPGWHPWAMRSQMRGFSPCHFFPPQFFGDAM